MAVLQSEVKSERVTCMSYSGEVSSSHSWRSLFSVTSAGSSLGFVTEDDGERDSGCLCTLLHVCACGKERHRCVQTHTCPKSHSSSQAAQTISRPFLQPCACLHLYRYPSSSSLMQRGRKRGHAVPSPSPMGYCLSKRSNKFWEKNLKTVKGIAKI